MSGYRVIPLDLACENMYSLACRLNALELKEEQGSGRGLVARGRVALVLAGGPTAARPAATQHRASAANPASTAWNGNGGAKADSECLERLLSIDIVPRAVRMRNTSESTV